MALLVAFLMNMANLLEPVTVDDVCHHYYAEQVSRDPLQPYEFESIWHQKPVDAWTIMVAPVHSYYWAPGIWLFGDSVLGWHLWFLPVQWLFCFSLLLLLRRWLRRGADSVMAILALGPAVLPGLNLMLEVPMLALGLSSLVALQRSFDRRSLGWAAFAGILWGVAFQTKYSAMAFFPPWFLLAFFRCRWREWLLGGCAAGATVLGIEALMSWSHEEGGSYFLQQLSFAQVRVWSHLWKGMFQHVGILGIPAALLAMIGFGAGRKLLWSAVAFYAVGVLLVGLFPDDGDLTLADGAIDSIAYVSMAGLSWLLLTAMLIGFLHAGLSGLRGWRVTGSRAMRLFLVAWCVCEIISSFVVSPFPAARRVLMVVVAFTASAGWFAVRRAGHEALLRGVVVVAVLLGAFVQGLDYLEGRAWVNASHGAVAYARQEYPHATLYFTGGWGFEFYAPRAGMAPLLEGRTQLLEGDLIAVAAIDHGEEPWFEPDPRIEEVKLLSFGNDGIPWSTQFSYYSGQRPFDGQIGPRFYVRILRAKKPLHTKELRLIPDGWDSRGKR